MSARDFLFVQSATEIGGAESVLFNLFEASAELRQRALVASLSFGSGNLPARLRALDVEVVELPKARVRDVGGAARTILALRRLIRARGVRVVVGNGAHPQVLGGLAARAARARAVYLVHMIHRTPLWANESLDMLALRGPCDLMLAVSKAAREPLAALRPNVESRLVYDGVPIREVTPEAAAQARAELGCAADDVLFGVFGRLQRWKGQDVFVAAAGEVARARPRARFVVVGGSVFGLEPEYFEGLRREAAALGLGERLTFTGFRNDVPRLMAACDVVCHTTRVAEPFGMVIVEAMMLGRPVIATRGGGPSEIIDSSASGVLVPPDDPSALAAAMIDLIDDAERRRDLGRHAATRARAAFTIERMADEVLAALAVLAGS